MKLVDLFKSSLLLKNVKNNKFNLSTYFRDIDQLPHDDWTFGGIDSDHFKNSTSQLSKELILVHRLLQSAQVPWHKHGSLLNKQVGWLKNLNASQLSQCVEKISLLKNEIVLLKIAKKLSNLMTLTLARNHAGDKTLNFMSVSECIDLLHENHEVINHSATYYSVGYRANPAPNHPHVKHKGFITKKEYDFLIKKNLMYMNNVSLYQGHIANIAKFKKSVILKKKRELITKINQL